MLETYPLLQKVRLELKKPWAPVGLPLETVSVEIERGWHTAYIALGSNLGDKEGYLNLAVQELRETRGCLVEAVSSYLRTEPYGYVAVSYTHLADLISQDELFVPMATPHP